MPDDKGTGREPSSLVQITKLWRKKDRHGREYMAGKIGLARILCFENRDKKADDDSDYIVYIAPGGGWSGPREGGGG